MNTTIRDGLGSGKQAEVDSDNRLSTKAISKHHIHDISYREGDAYCVSIDTSNDRWTITTSGGAMLLLKNNDADKDLFIDRVHFSVSVDSSGEAAFWLLNDVTIGTLADYTEQTPKNLNFGSANTPNINCYAWDGVNNGIGGLTVGSYLWPLYLKQSAITEVDYKGSIIVPQNHNFGIWATATTAVAKINLAVTFFML